LELNGGKNMSTKDHNTAVADHNQGIMTQDDIDIAVRALIALASSTIEADSVVRAFNEHLDKDEKLPGVLQDKYNYVSSLFKIDQLKRASCDPDPNADLEIAATNYYSLLSVLILKKWS
jgi:hypothetical protein